MGRLIDADTLKNRLTALVRGGTDLNYCIAEMIDRAPTIEPDRKKGKWIECDHDKWIVGAHTLRCSECNEGYHLRNETTIYYWNFCPNCGARMMEGEE